MSDFLKILLSMSLGGSLTALVLLALRALLRRRTPHRVFYYLWLLVLLRLCLPLPGLVNWAGLAAPAEKNTLSYATAGSAAAVSIDLAQTENEAPEVYGPLASEAYPLQPTPSLNGDVGAAEVPTVLHVESGYRVNYPLILTFLWLAGAVLSVVYFADGYALFARKVRRTARPALDAEQALLSELRPEGDVTLLRSAFVPTPLLMGFLRPAIVLPERDYLPGELRCVLRHELTHYRRMDLPYKWFAMLTLSLHWFNPLSYVIRYFINRDCELSCDEAVIASMSPREKQCYGETLIRLAGDSPLPAGVPATTLCEGKEHLRERLVSIMEYKPWSALSTALALLCALLLCSCGLAVGSGSTVTQTAAESAAEEEIFFSYAMNNYATDGNAYATDGNALAQLAYNPDTFLFATDGNAHYAEGNTVTVSTVEELLNALGRYTTIVLESGVYNLSEARAGAYSFVYWKPLGSGMGHQLMARYVDNVKLIGQSGDPADVVIRGGDGLAALLDFLNCNNLNFSHLTFQCGEGGIPGSAALRLQNCFSVYLEDCVLSGGVELQAESVTCITLKDCVLTPADASYFSFCEGVLLEDCSIESLIDASVCPPLGFFNTTNILFRRCTLNGEPLRAGDILRLAGTPDTL